MSSTKKLNAEVIIERLKGRPIKLIGNYINASTPTKFQCLNESCQFIWAATPYNVTGPNKSGCPECSKYNRHVDNSVIDKAFKERKLERLSEYKGMNKYMTVKCLVDGYTWDIKPGSIINSDQGCPECGRKSKILTNEYIDEFIKDKPFIRVSNYVDTFTRLDWKCKKDGNIWTTTFTEIRRGSGCPQCRHKSEGKLKESLEIEYKIHDLKFQYVLHGSTRNYVLDFYFERNEHKIAIEYNGEQHYEPVRFGGISIEDAEENYKNQIVRDREVKELCEKNNIHLIIIPYWLNDSEVKTILTENFNLFF